MKEFDFEKSLMNKVRSALKEDSNYIEDVQPNWEKFKAHNSRKGGLLKGRILRAGLIGGLVLILGTYAFLSSSIVSDESNALLDEQPDQKVSNDRSKPIPSEELKPVAAHSEFESKTTSKATDLRSAEKTIKKVHREDHDPEISNETPKSRDLAIKNHSTANLEIKTNAGSSSELLSISSLNHVDPIEFVPMISPVIDKEVFNKAREKAFGKNYVPVVPIPDKIVRMFSRMRAEGKLIPRQYVLEKPSPWEVSISYAPNFSYEDQFFLGSVGINYNQKLLSNLSVSVGLHYFQYDSKDHVYNEFNNRSYEYFDNDKFKALEVPVWLHWRLPVLRAFDFRMVAGVNVSYTIRRFDEYRAISYSDVANQILSANIHHINYVPLKEVLVTGAEGGVSLKVATWRNHEVRVTGTYSFPRKAVIEKTYFRFRLGFSL